MAGHPARQHEETIHEIEHVAVSTPGRERKNVMDGKLRRFRVAFVTGLVTLSLTAFAGGVSATPGPTPNGHIGACNMLQAWGVGARGGMANAMSVNNPNGNLGMWRAVANTSITGLAECPSY